MNSEKRLTLYELNSLVREVLECEMPDEYWVEAHRGNLPRPSPRLQHAAGPQNGCLSAPISSVPQASDSTSA